MPPSTILEHRGAVSLVPPTNLEDIDPVSSVPLSKLLEDRDAVSWVPPSTLLEVSDAYFGCQR